MLEPVTVCPPRDSRLVFGMACSRLRALQPEHPRVYAVAAMADQGKRRWWRLAEGTAAAHCGRVEGPGISGA